jgi:hypothetical protein
VFLKLVLRGLQASEVLEKYRFDFGNRLKILVKMNMGFKSFLRRFLILEFLVETSRRLWSSVTQ